MVKATIKHLKFVLRLPTILVRRTKEFHMEHDKVLTTVHHALQQASTEPKQYEGAMGTHTFRIHDALKKDAANKCLPHGVSLDAFLRKCCEALVNDYKS